MKDLAALVAAEVESRIAAARGLRGAELIDDYQTLALVWLAQTAGGVARELVGHRDSPLRRLPASKLRDDIGEYAFHGLVLELLYAIANDKNLAALGMAITYPARLAGQDAVQAGYAVAETIRSVGTAVGSGSTFERVLSEHFLSRCMETLNVASDEGFLGAIEPVIEEALTVSLELWGNLVAAHEGRSG